MQEQTTGHTRDVSLGSDFAVYDRVVSLTGMFGGLFCDRDVSLGIDFAVSDRVLTTVYAYAGGLHQQAKKN